MKKNVVTVLLSTYNGEKYLRDQIDSVLCQKNVEVKLVVRDDGSKDNTCSILKEYEEKYNNIILLLEENLGVEPSFEKLTQWTKHNSPTDYYAFCDQDDVWFDEKLSKSIKAIKNKKEPALFCSNQMVTDQDLNPIGLMIEKNNYERLLRVMEVNYFKNRHGCTMLWNKELHEYLVNTKHSIEYCPAHDKWIMLLGRLTGTVIVSDEPLMYYRQHGTNVYGLTLTRWGKFKKAIQRYWIRDNECDMYANDCLNSLPQTCFLSKGGKYVKMIGEYRNRIMVRLKIAFSYQVWGEGFNEGVIHSISVLLKKY